METFDKVIAVNLRGTMMCYKYAGQEMIKQDRGGRIIGTYDEVKLICIHWSWDRGIICCWKEG